MLANLNARELQALQARAPIYHDQYRVSSQHVQFLCGRNGITMERFLNIEVAPDFEIVSRQRNLSQESLYPNASTSGETSMASSGYLPFRPDSPAHIVLETGAWLRSGYFFINAPLPLMPLAPVVPSIMASTSCSCCSETDDDNSSTNFYSMSASDFSEDAFDRE